MSGDTDFPPRRSREILAGWVDDFVAAGNAHGAALDVIVQDADDDGDTGLVIMRLRKAEAIVYMQPRGTNDPLWEMTLTGRPEDVTMNPYDLGSLGAELVVAANLCTFLQYRSLEWDRDSGRR